MSASHEFTPAQVEAAIRFVVHNGAEDRGQTISYSRVFDAAGLPAPQYLHMGGESHLVTEFMAAFHHLCVDKGLPPLDSLVVHVAGPRKNFPGAGYFRVNQLPDPLGEKTRAVDQVTSTQFWERQREACRSWGVQSRRGRV
ncbi:hypothetical protein MRQ36_05555 [Micromonospora sp. R77]|uniref:hypothetical protein n=1 Tax=Micromonospora sp. R77 TaxID=2925836 RepID=UPI001F604B85|nr:hypothetical protein [Micromonospora sp. R77]MCI4062057.1 hypothetical protein [Micromonospora sp. R77]